MAAGAVDEDLPPGFELEEDEPDLPPGFVLERPKVPMKGQPSMFSRALALPGRASDYALGLGAQGIAAVEGPVVRGVAKWRGVENAPQTQKMLASVDALRKHGEDLQAGTSTYGHELAEEIPEPGPDSGAAGHALGVVRAGVEFGGDMARDPLTYGALGALKKLGVAGKGLTAAASAMFTIQAGKAVTPELLEAQRIYNEDGKWTPRATEQVAKAVLLGGAAVMGALHTPHAFGEVVKATLPDRGGEVYRADPNVTPEQIAALDAKDAATAERQNEVAGVRVDALDRAQQRLAEEAGGVSPGSKNNSPPNRAGADDAAAYEQQRLAEEQTRTQLPTPPVRDFQQPRPITLETKGPLVDEIQRPMDVEAPAPRLRPRGLADVGPGIEPAPKGAKVPGVRFSPAAAEVAQELGAKPQAIPQSRTPEGYRKLAAQREGGSKESLWQGGPEVARKVKGRLLELWNQEKGAGQTEDASGPVQEQAVVSPWYERLGRQFVRTMEPAFQATERLPVVGEELAGRQRAYVTDWEKLKGEADADSIRALQSVGLDVRNPKAMAANPLADQIQAFVDGRAPLESIPENARAAAENLRQIGLKMAQAKVEAGIIKPEDVLEHHWPRQSNTPESFTLMEKARQYARDNGGTVEDALAVLDKNQIQGVRTSRKVGSSQARAAGAEALRPDQYRTDWGAWFDDIRESSREVAEARHLGKNGETALALVSKLRGIPVDHEFALGLLDRIRGAEQQTKLHRFSSNVRSIQSAIGLVTSPITQAGTLMNTAAETSVAATAKAIADTFTKPVLGTDGKPMRWTQPIKRLRAAMNDARLGATRVGAMNAEIAGSFADYYTKNNSQAGEKGTALSSKVGGLGTVRAAGWMDGMMRVIATKTAPHIVPLEWAQAKAGNKLSQRQLDNWHVDWRRSELTPEMIDTAARRISERSQFKVGVGDIPLWASSPLGKIAFQFQSFGYAHAKFVGGAVDEARQGNVKPLAKLLTLGAGMGYLTNEAKQAIFSGKDPKKLDEDTFGNQVADVYGHGASYSTEGARGKALAYIEGLAAEGGLGALTGAYERLGSGDPTKILLGASGADAEALARAGKEWSEGNVGKATGRLVQGFLPVGPLGVNPRELASEALSDKPISSPGYAGRIVDAARGKEGATKLGAVPIVSQLAEMAGGPKRTVSTERTKEGRREHEGKLEKMANDEAGTITTAAPEKPIDERIKTATRSRVMAQFKLEMAKAVRRGASQDQLDQIREKFMDALGEEEKPVKMGWKAEDRLRSRVILDEEEAAQ